jgi:multicomponent Na+:H+ antiporter subunit G
VAEILAYGLMLVGAIFTFIAALGVVRLPDLFMRMHASTKSATLGVGFIMLGAAVYFSDVTITTRAVAVILFLLVTAPISSHLLARAAYFSGIPLWEKTLSDDLRGHYDPKTHQLSGEEEDPPSSGDSSEDGGPDNGPSFLGERI